MSQNRANFDCYRNDLFSCAGPLFQKYASQTTKKFRTNLERRRQTCSVLLKTDDPRESDVSGQVSPEAEHESDARLQRLFCTAFCVDRLQLLRTSDARMRDVDESLFLTT